MLSKMHDVSDCILVIACLFNFELLRSLELIKN
jgi:hypothetical protein